MHRRAVRVDGDHPGDHDYRAAVEAHHAAGDVAAGITQLHLATARRGHGRREMQEFGGRDVKGTYSRSQHSTG